MKKLNKLVAAFLCMCMVFAMTACGKKDGGTSAGASSTEKKDFFSIASESVDTGKISMDMKMKISDKDESLKKAIGSDEITVKLDGDVQSENNQIKGLNLNVSAVIGSDNVDLTDIIYKDTTIYVNVEKVANAVIPYLEKSGTKVTSSQILAMIGGKKYISVSDSELKQYLDLASAGSGTSMTSELLTSNATKYSEVFQKVLQTPFKDTLNKVEPSVFSQDGDNYTLKIDKDNIESLFDQLATLADNDGEKLLNQLKEEVKTTCGEDDDLYKSLNGTDASKQLEEIKTGLSNAKKNIASVKEAEPLIKMTVSSTGNEGSRVLKANVELSMNDKESSTAMDIVVDCSMTEDKNVTFTAPTDVASITEVMTTLQGLMGGSTAK